MLTGERVRDFVLSDEQVGRYLAAAPQPLRDVATLILETGLRIGEALSLKWHDVNLTAAIHARLGYLQIRAGKSRAAICTTPLSEQFHALIAQLSRADNDSPFVRSCAEHD